MYKVIKDLNKTIRLVVIILCYLVQARAFGPCTSIEITLNTFYKK